MLKNFLLSFLFGLSGLLGVSLLSGCGTIETLTPKMGGVILKKASKEMETESNWDFFREGALANLKMIEGLLYLNPGEKRLLSTLVKGYTSYGLLVQETLMLESSARSSTPSGAQGEVGAGCTSESYHKQQAIAAYGKALNYAFSYLKSVGLTYDDLLSSSRTDVNDAKDVKDGKGVKNVKNVLEQNLDFEDLQDVDAIFFMAQAWGGLINLEKNNPKLLADLSLVKWLTDWVCGHYPNYFHGGCDLFYGVYESSRPPLLGGNPQKGEEFFKRAIANNPGNLFAEVLFIQYYYVPMEDKDGYLKLRPELQQKINRFYQNMEWSSTNIKIGKVVKEGDDEHLNLLNATAGKRWQSILTLEKDNKIF
ncbi:MAG: hypothetical protein HQK53_04845 [Oligoflexia bacterium]|nr:hypothetical protein [Oligoflexia bacterium]